MDEGKFTMEAAVVWSTIPVETRALLLKNVFCVQCRDMTQIVRFKGTIKKRDLVLKGSCAKCGHKVTRIIESSEDDLSQD